MAAAKSSATWAGCWDAGSEYPSSLSPTSWRSSSGRSPYGRRDSERGKRKEHRLLKCIRIEQ
ncbi:unnamed protein product [Larinioides sclopetarius]|uniref:Uncharacterized protein n=1 Tax=Larinioides sclopetarius TaxID=280406 RepID=A0AAV2BYJ5_9ARAC